MNSLVIVVALVIVTCTDAAHLGNNYVVPAINNNELQDTYILPATKSQSTYVTLPVSVLNTHISSQPVEVSQNNVISSVLKIKSTEVQLPKSISSVLAKSTQKTIQGTVQKIIQKTVSTSIPSKSSLQSTNAYLPPKTKTSAAHKHLPELIDKPPKATQEIVKTYNPPATVKVSQYIDNSSALKSKSSEVHLPGIINTSTSTKTIEKTIQKTVNIASKPEQVSQRTVIYSTPNTKATKLNFSDIVHNYDSIPTKTIKNTVNTSVQPLKAAQITGISSKSSEVHLSESSIISTPLKTIEKTVKATTETAKLSQNTGISSSSQAKLPEVHLLEKIYSANTVNIPSAPVKVSQRIDTSSPLKSKSSEVQISRNTDTTSTLKTNSSQVKIENTSNTPALVTISQNPDISSLTSVVKTVNSPILTTSVQVSKNTNTASTLKTKSSEMRLPKEINISAPKLKTIESTVNILAQPVQVRQRIDNFSTVKTKSSEVRLPVQISTTLPTKSSISVPSKTVQVSQASTHPAALRSPPSLWHLPKLIDIVQKTIKTSVNSNIKPKEVEEPVITKILPGSAHGAENSYLPPDLKKKH